MRRIRRLTSSLSLRHFSGVLLALLVGCASTDEEAQKLLELGRFEIQAAQQLDLAPPSISGADKTRAEQLARVKKALELTTLIAQKFPETLIGQGVSTGRIELQGIPLRDLREQILPRLELRVKAESDPLLTAQVLASSIEDPQARTELQVALARSFEVSGRSSESFSMLRQALLASSSIADPAVRILRLSDIAVAHANSSRRADSLEVAFAALSSAKQITNTDARAAALTKVALVYYLLGVDQRGYEALQSISDRSLRAAALKEIAEALLEKNLPLQALAASTSLFNVETRLNFLVSLAQSAKKSESSTTILLFLDHSIPLIAKLSTPRSKATMLLTHASLLRSADRSERAANLVAQSITTLEGNEPSNVDLLSEAALEYARLAKTAEAIALIQKTLVILRSNEHGSSSEDIDSLSAVRLQALKNIGTAYAISDEPTRALDVLKLIDQEGPRSLAFAEVAKASIANGSEGFAKRFLEEAEVLLPRLSAPTERSALLLALRDSFLAAKRLQDALRCALALRQEDKRWKSYVRGFQEQLFQAGYLDEAIQLARTTEDPFLRAVLLIEAAKVRYRNGAMNEVVSFLEEAASAADVGKDKARSISLAALIADTMLEVKLPRLALLLVEKNDFSDRPMWLCRIAESFVSTGQRQDAVETLYSALKLSLSLSRPEDKARVLMRVGEVFAHMDLAVGIEGSTYLTQLMQGH